MSSAQQRLDEVRALDQGHPRKRAIGSGKGDRQLDRAQLASLRMLEEQYVKQAAQEVVAGSVRPRISRLYSRGKGI